MTDERKKIIEYLTIADQIVCKYEEKLFLKEKLLGIKAINKLKITAIKNATNELSFGTKLTENFYKSLAYKKMNKLSKFDDDMRNYSEKFTKLWKDYGALNLAYEIEHLDEIEELFYRYMRHNYKNLESLQIYDDSIVLPSRKQILKIVKRKAPKENRANEKYLNEQVENEINTILIKKYGDEILKLSVEEKENLVNKENDIRLYIERISFVSEYANDYFVEFNRLFDEMKEKHKKIIKDSKVAEENYNNLLKEDVVSKKYLRSGVIKGITELFIDGRADTLKEAINLYESYGLNKCFIKIKNEQILEAEESIQEIEKAEIIRKDIICKRKTCSNYLTCTIKHKTYKGLLCDNYVLGVCN